MDKLMSAAEAADVKMPLSILDLDWFPQIDKLRIRYIKRGIQTFCWLMLEREDIERLTKTMLDCLMNHSITRGIYGDYTITIDASLSEEDSLPFEITVIKLEDGDSAVPIFRESFDSYIGGISLLEGIRRFMRIYKF